MAIRIEEYDGSKVWRATDGTRRFTVVVDAVDFALTSDGVRAVIRDTLEAIINKTATEIVEANSELIRSLIKPEEIAKAVYDEIVQRLATGILNGVK